MTGGALLADGTKRRAYPLHQCALYKLSSKGKLATLLGFDSPAELVALSSVLNGYNVFLKEEFVCPFTGKKTKARWVQEPKPELKRAQRRIQKLVARVRAPDYCHGGLTGHSYRSNAKCHIGGNRCATFDIKSFFPSTTSSRVFDFFKDQLQCAPDLAKILTNLCCYQNALPTGAPTSPILSLYANRGLFDAMAQLAENHKLVFTVYIDDVTFTGDVIPRGLTTILRTLVEKSGHRLSEHKSKHFAKGQPRHITGVVVHDGKVKVPYSRFQKARAIELAITTASNLADKLVLTNKLVGLVGEAAYLDSRFKPRAEAVYRAAENLRAQVASESTPTSKP